MPVLRRRCPRGAALDALTLALAVGGGTVAGLATGLVPGVHVNTVCTVVLAVAASLGPVAAVGLSAMAVAHATASLLPSTYLGAPGEETLMSALPAHRLLLEGRGPDAVRAGLDGGLAGLAVAVAVALPYKWLLGEPGRLLDALDTAMLWVLLAVLAFLLLRDARGGWRAVAWSAAVLALSGAVGLLGTRVTVAALVPVATTPLLPMLSGLFGTPALLETLRAMPQVPDQRPAAHLPAHLRRLARRGVGLGVAAAAATAVLPGMSSSVAAAVAAAGSKSVARAEDARPMLATLAAIAGAHVVLTFVVLWLSLRARTGLAVAVQQLWGVAPWAAGPAPLPLRLLLLGCLAAGLLAYVGTALMAGPAARTLPRLDQRAVAAVALAVMLAVVVLFSGPWGLALHLVAVAVGLVPLAAGLGRVHLTGCLLVPVVLFRAGVA